MVGSAPRERAEPRSADSVWVFAIAGLVLALALIGLAAGFDAIATAR